MRRGPASWISESTSRALVTHAVFVGLTPLIPIPFLDDIVRTFFARSLIQSLAHNANLALSDAEIAALAEARGPGCLYGCLFGPMEFAVKRLVRKAIFILEWRRAVDLITHTYYAGRLLAYAFAQGWYEPGDAERAERLRRAVEEARAGANLGLARRVVAATLRQSRDLIATVVAQLAASVRGIAFRQRRRADVEAAVAERLERETPRIRMTAGDLIERLQVNLGAIPDDHFELMQARLRAALRTAENYQGASGG